MASRVANVHVDCVRPPRPVLVYIASLSDSRSSRLFPQKVGDCQKTHRSPFLDNHPKSKLQKYCITIQDNIHNIQNNIV